MTSGVAADAELLREGVESQTGMRPGCPLARTRVEWDLSIQAPPRPFARSGGMAPES